MLRSIVIAIICFGCTEPPVADDGPAADARDGEFSPLAGQVLTSLKAGHAGERGQTWATSLDNSFASDWVVQTPDAKFWGEPASALPVVATCAGDPKCDPDFDLLACTTQSDCRFGGTCRAIAATVSAPGQTAKQLCAGHSDALYDQIYGMVVQAQSSVVISSLSPPDGRFEAALRNAFTYLASSDRAIRARYLYGAVIGGGIAADPRTTDEVLASLVRDVPAGSQLRAAVGAYRDGPLSWDHAKAIVIDGQTALVGGHNMWTRHYLQAAPVHDLSLVITGSAAYDAARFVDVLWRHTCQPPVELGSVGTTSGYPDASEACATLDIPRPIATGTARAITVGRLGQLGDEAADDAILALLDNAQQSLALSLQDIGPVGEGAPWPEPYLRALASAIGRGVDVRMIVTNLNARPDGLSAGSSSYSNGWTPSDLVHHVTSYMGAHPEIAAASAICDHLHVAALRQGADETWPDGATFANHAKLAIADGQTFYLGSQNWYPANLVELGYIVDDATAAQELDQAYYANAWTASERTAVCN